MSKFSKNILLVNPWIYDFAAYDFWCKPLGLLYLGACLRRQGYEVHLLDCMDRFHPEMQKIHSTLARDSRADGTGKFFRQIISKPKVLDFVPRHYCRYGMPSDVVTKILSELPAEPDVILVTSFMTYWYPGVRDIIQLLRSVFPHAVIILGGIYATLCPDHALKEARPDHIILGEGEQALMDFFAEHHDKGKTQSCSNLDDIPFPLYDLYPCLNSVALLTSRGCPLRCSYCASQLLCPRYRRRSPENVFQELQILHDTFAIRHLAFCDDALLHSAQNHLVPLLIETINQGWNFNFYTPNGLSPRLITKQIADIMYAAGFREVKLSFETINSERQKAMSSKVTKPDLQRGVESLEKSGFKRKDIGVYLMMGLPGQEVEEVIQSVNFVHEIGVKIHMSSFSPIPGTVEYKKAIKAGVWAEDHDLLLTNTTIYPIWSQTMGYSKANDLYEQIKSLNAQL